MTFVLTGLTLVIAAAAAAFFKRWSVLSLLGVLAGLLLVVYGVSSMGHDRVPISEEVLASDSGNAVANGDAAQNGHSQVKKDDDSDAPPAKTSQQEGESGAKEEVAPDIPEHVLRGNVQPWTEEVKRLIAKPNHYPLLQAGDAPEDAPNKGDRIYEYTDLKLGGRYFQTVFLSKNPHDGATWMVHLEPGMKGVPIKPEELGSARILGEGGNFIVFKLVDGPFAGDYLVWASGGHRGGGEAVRIYSPSFLKREHGLAQQIAAAAAKP